jgi:hypothetical protein
MVRHSEWRKPALEKALLVHSATPPPVGCIFKSVQFPLSLEDCVAIGVSGRNSEKRNRQTSEKALERNL